MNKSDFSILVPWVIAHGYLIFFIAALIEGPFVTAAGGVAAALGYYNIYLIMLLAIAGDIGGDILYYGLGYNFSKLVRSGKLQFLGITYNRVGRIEKILHEQTIRAVMFVKLAPFIGPPGLIILGSVRAPIKKFTKAALIIAVPKSLLFALLGYYSAAAYIYLDKTIARGQYALAIIIGVALLIYLLYKKVVSVMAKELEK